MLQGKDITSVEVFVRFAGFCAQLGWPALKINSIPPERLGIDLCNFKCRPSAFAGQCWKSIQLDIVCD